MLWNSLIYFFFSSTNVCCVSLWLKFLNKVNASNNIKASVGRVFSTPLTSYLKSVSFFVRTKSWRKAKVIVFLFSKEFFWARRSRKRMILKIEIAFFPNLNFLCMHNSKISRNIKFQIFRCCNISYFYCRNVVGFIHNKFSWILNYILVFSYVLESAFFLHKHDEGRGDICKNHDVWNESEKASNDCVKPLLASKVEGNLLPRSVEGSQEVADFVLEFGVFLVVSRHVC